MADTQTTTQTDKNSLSGGQIALIIIGCVLVIGLVAALIAWLVSDKKKKKNSSKTNTVQIGGPVNSEIKQQDNQTAQQSNVVKISAPKPVQASFVQRRETVTEPTESITPTEGLLGYIPQEETEEQPDMYEKLGLLASIMNDKPEEKTEKQEEKKEEVKKEEEKAKKEEPDKNEKPKENKEEAKKEDAPKEEPQKDDKKENNDKQVAKKNAEDDEELDLIKKEKKEPLKLFDGLGLGKIANQDDKKNSPEEKETEQDDALDDDSELSQLFKTFGLGGDKNANQILDNPGNQQLGGSGNMPDTPDPIKLNMPAPTTKQPFNAPMPKPIGGISGAGGPHNVKQPSPGMFNMGQNKFGQNNLGQNNNFQNMPSNMVPPPMPMQSNKPLMSGFPGPSQGDNPMGGFKPYQNGNPTMNDNRQNKNYNNGADFSFSETEEQPVQTNNNQSQINLGTQNKCNCPECIGNQ